MCVCEYHHGSMNLMGGRKIQPPFPLHDPTLPKSPCGVLSEGRTLTCQPAAGTIISHGSKSRQQRHVSHWEQQGQGCAGEGMRQGRREREGDVREREGDGRGGSGWRRSSPTATPRNSAGQSNRSAGCPRRHSRAPGSHVSAACCRAGSSVCISFARHSAFTAKSLRSSRRIACVQ